MTRRITADERGAVFFPEDALGPTSSTERNLSGRVCRTQASHRTGRKWRGRLAPSIVIALVDPVRPAAGPRRDRLLGGIGAVAVAVAEGERRLDLELALEAVAPLLPAFLVLELVLVQGGRLLDAMRVAELDCELPRGAPHFVPRRAERELIGDGADPAGVDVARECEIGRAHV